MFALAGATGAAAGLDAAGALALLEAGGAAVVLAGTFTVVELVDVDGSDCGCGCDWSCMIVVVLAGIAAVLLFSTVTPITIAAIITTKTTITVPHANPEVVSSPEFGLILITFNVLCRHLASAPTPAPLFAL